MYERPTHLVFIIFLLIIALHELILHFNHTLVSFKTLLFYIPACAILDKVLFIGCATLGFGQNTACNTTARQ